ncbi:pseudouridine synthase [Saccharata proteae CBS 121410]|uniref:tRNA pseudouridine synthase 1 n=1 Tax=Saccharata proteae CBS 121410 TaxID=1314787 RepID=A0A9P4LWI4_9PEZI|nr:pseudouridine synthase [Saccharata proteae CBS 121410]
MGQDHTEQASAASMDTNNPPAASTGGDDSSARGGKRKWQNHRLQHGSRGGRGDKRARNEREQAKRRKLEDEGKETESVLPKAFSQEEIAAEDRRPKRKVVVLMGYSGSGYKGMQINTTERTIEGDLFTAFVKAGAISKANADDPKKSALVRCARTDKGVHAAGNVISLKLIVEDEDIVQKINSHLSPQIRVWGIERTTGSFSAYQACDSRWYEYLLPTYCLVPPHPNSFLGKKLVELADEVGDREGYEDRQKEAAGFWDEVDRTQIKPALAELDPRIRELVEKALYETETDPEAPNEQANGAVAENAADLSKPVRVTEPKEAASASITGEEKSEEAAIIIQAPPAVADPTADEIQPVADSAEVIDQSRNIRVEDIPAETEKQDSSKLSLEDKRALDTAIKQIKQIYLDAKKAYRAPRARLDRLQDALNKYVGTRNYHNYTVSKKFTDPSAKRHIKSFKMAEDPIVINDTEWISLKVHGQSFMMHQIRKMVGMAALVVRCGCPTERIVETFGNVSLGVPKAPGLGLLLERPVFDSYNEKAASKFEKEPIEFTKFEKEMEEFKQREIYERIFREEERDHQFNAFFSHIDGYKEHFFLYLTSKGIKAAMEPKEKGMGKAMEYGSDSDGEAGDG